VFTFSRVLACTAFAIFRVKSLGDFGSCCVDLTEGRESEKKLSLDKAMLQNVYPTGTNHFVNESR
jgi:hypothetical protein